VSQAFVATSKFCSGHQRWFNVSTVWRLSLTVAFPPMIYDNVSKWPTIFMHAYSLCQGGDNKCWCPYPLNAWTYLYNIFGTVDRIYYKKCWSFRVERQQPFFLIITRKLAASRSCVSIRVSKLFIQSICRGRPRKHFTLNIVWAPFGYCFSYLHARM